MSKKDIKVGDKVVFRNKYISELHAIVESINEYGRLKCRLCEPITHIEVMPTQIEVVSNTKRENESDNRDSR